MTVKVTDATTLLKIPGVNGGVEFVPLSKTFVGKYQRKLTSFVKRIETQFEPALVGTLTLSKRSSGKYALIDGQTRAEGMKRNGIDAWVAVVYYDLSLEREAELFALFQTERRAMTSSDRFNAQVVAKDPHALAIVEVLKPLGFFVENNNAEPGALKAIGAIEYVYHGAAVGMAAKATQDPELLRDTLEVIRGAWPRLPDTAKSRVIIQGVGYFLATTDNVDLERLTLRLSKLSPSALAKRAEALREGEGVSGKSPSHTAQAIAAQYRSRAR